MISAIICTYNRSPLLDRTLTSFFEQTCLRDVDHELLVVDNNSNDDTRDVVEKFNRHPTLRYVFEPKQGLSAARNRGIAEARGEFVAFLDDDVNVDSEWLRRLEDCFAVTDAAVVGGRSYLIFDAPAPDWFGPDFHKVLSEVNLGTSRKPVPDGVGLFGLNLAFRRSALQVTGGFDEALGRRGSALLGSEEVAVIRGISASGGLVIYDPDVVVGHIIEPDRLQWDYFARLADGIGRSLAIRDRQVSLFTRFTAVVRSTIALAFTSCTVLTRTLSCASPYEQKSVLRRMLTARSRLTAHWRQLWSHN